MGTHNSGQMIPKDDRDAFWYIPRISKFYCCSDHSNDSKDDRDAFWYIPWTPHSIGANKGVSVLRTTSPNDYPCLEFVFLRST
jgi:hypothetical protein